MRLVIVATLVASLLGAGLALAGTTGKISGVVKDADTGEPLPGANIIIQGTTMGAAADQNGFFFIINIPPGRYTLKAMMIGYAPQTVTNVLVQADVTTKVNFALHQKALRGQAVTVVAERPPIQKDLTSSLQSFSRNEIASAPTDNLNQLIEIQAGVVPVDEMERASIVRDTPGDGLHIRGGRENETAFLVDGVRVDNPIWGGADFVQHSSGTSVSEMMTILGTFNAEYGGKMSGVINLVTKEGGEKYSGQINTYTDNFGIKAFNRHTYFGDVTASGPMPFYRAVTFFSDYQMRTTDGRFYGFIVPHWTDSKGQVPIAPHTGAVPYGGLDGRGKVPKNWKRVPLDWKDEWHALVKLTWHPFSGFKLMASYVGSHVRRARYYHAYRYLPYNNPWSDSRSGTFTLKITHQLSPKTFYDLSASYQNIQFWSGVHKIREQRIVMGSRLTDDVYGFYYSGAPNNYWADTSSTYQLNFNLTSQVTSKHLVKTGFSIRDLDLFHRLETAWTTAVDKVVVGTDEEGRPVTEYFENHKAFAHSNPREWAAYIQDKMEFEDIGMIMNIGLRWERWDVNEKYMQNPKEPMTTPLLPTRPKVRLSPRLGISYPVSDKAAFHFAYGHFYQFPSYVDLLSGINERGRYPGRPNLQDVGLAIFNPNIKPEKSVTYEAGVQAQILENTTLNATAFYRELADLVGVTWIQTAGYVYFENVDFGNSKGIEFTLNKRFSNHFAARVNYTLSQTLISTSSPLTAAQTVSSHPIAYRTFLADWDRTHDFSAFVLISDPKSWAVSINTAIRSGRPYTVLAEVKNTERMPWYFNVDMRLSKYFEWFGHRETLYLQMFNVFNRRNIYSVYPVTGKWDDDGDAGTPYAHDANPRRISDGRRARIGLKVEF